MSPVTEHYTESPAPRAPLGEPLAPREASPDAVASFLGFVREVGRDDASLLQRSVSEAMGRPELTLRQRVLLGVIEFTHALLYMSKRDLECALREAEVDMTSRYAAVMSHNRTPEVSLRSFDELRLAYFGDGTDYSAVEDIPDHFIVAMVDLETGRSVMDEVIAAGPLLDSVAQPLARRRREQREEVRDDA